MKFTIENITKHPVKKIEPTDIYATLCRCRDFELSHLWQRSVFLTAFLVLTYTGYGCCVFTQIDLDKHVSNSSYTTIFIIGFFLLFIGMVISQLWIMMGKASKAWYERYELAIYAIEHDVSFALPVVTETMNRKNVMHGNLPLPLSCDRNLFTTNAGAFSPSRINIFIGQLSWLLLFIASIGHSIVSSLSGKMLFFYSKPSCLIVFSVLTIIGLNFVSFFLIRKMVTSRTLLAG